MKENTGFYLHTQRLSTEDGPGIRTSVFMKGCPLRCWWCHNPESLSTLPQTQWNETRCIGCGTCVQVCPQGCLTMTQDGIVIDRECCQSCGTCAEACPGNAMELLGKHVTAEDLYQELRKDRAFFETSNGGVTISGGEPMIQSDFVAELLSMLKEDAVHTAIDTCGFCPSKNFTKVLPYVDLVLFDLKEMDPEKHRAYTGQVNQRILDNLLVVRDFISSHNDRSLWVRTPLIPGATASEANITQIGNFIAQHLSGFVDRWELCAFNNLCRDKYRRLGMNWRYEGSSLLAKDELLEWERIAKGSGVDPEIVIATGATQVHVF